MIEKGRHTNIDRDMRFCPYCLNKNTLCIETEQHFLLYCPVYEDLRALYFKEEWKNRPSNDQLFIHVMNARDTNSVLVLAKFVTNAMLLRKFKIEQGMVRG